MESGASQAGCVMGPDSFRSAGLKSTIESLGYHVQDLGNMVRDAVLGLKHSNGMIHNLDQTVGWATTLAEAAYKVIRTS